MDDYGNAFICVDRYLGTSTDSITINRIFLATKDWVENLRAFVIMLL